MHRGRARNRSERRLKASEIARLPPGRHEDGGGLRLVVEPSGARRWVQRVTINGKRHDRGLGPLSRVSLGDARDESLKIRRAARGGRDHIADQKEHQARMVTFRSVFKSAILLKQRETVSPCYGVREQLGVKNRKVEHHVALPYAEVPAFIGVRASPSQPTTKLAFEWLILTATRSGETRGARFDEIDAEAALWTIPAERMKGRREHEVPLPKRCLQIAKEARALHPNGDIMFPGPRSGEELSDMTFTKVLRDLRFADRATAHGFRSSFRDWATEIAKVREVVAEAALAHTVRDKTEAAYRRAAYLVERRTLMQRWAAYCTR